MIIKLSASEKKVLQTLDPKGSGPKPWQSARDIAAVVFRKKAENTTQEEIRVVRNAFRKPVREALVEMNPSERGQYRISERGRKLINAKLPDFESRFQRGEATQAAKSAGEARMKERPRKTKAAPKKATKKAAKAAKAPKKAAPKKATKKAAPKKSKTKSAKAPKKAAAPKIKVEDKTSEASAGPGTNGNGEHKKPKFKRRQALKVKNAPKTAAAEN